MRKFLLLFSFLLGLGVNAQSLDWVQTFSTAANSIYPNDLAKDASGNLLMCGSFGGTLGLNGQSYSSNGGLDSYVIKTDSLGNILWVRTFGNSSSEAAVSLATDNAANVYVTGYFADTVDFDPGAGEQKMGSKGSFDPYVLKLDANGNFLWVRTFGGSSMDAGMNIQVDGLGNVYSAGHFRSIVDFNPGTANETRFPVGQSDVYVQKLDSAGNFKWVITFGGIGLDEVRDMALDQLGQLYLTGFFSHSADFDPSSAQFILNTDGSRDFYVTRLDTSGAFIWATSGGGKGVDETRSISLDQLGNVYLSGTFSDSVIFNSNSGSAAVVPNGSYDIFVQKLDGLGNVLWTQVFGGADFEAVNDLAVNPNGDILLTGVFRDSLDFDPGQAHDSLISVGGEDAFVAKWDAMGNHLWAVPIGSARTDQGLLILCDDNGAIYGALNYMDSVDIEPGSGQTIIQGTGGANVALYKWNDCNPYLKVDSVVACGSYTWIDGVTYTTSDSTATFIIPGASSCDTLVQLNLILNSALDTNVQVNGGTLMASNANASYQWIDCLDNFKLIAGANSRSFTPTQNGSFAVILNENGCVDTSACISLSNISVGSELGLDDLVVGPNPSNGYLHINASELWQNADFYLMNSQGQIVQQGRLKDLNEGVLEWHEPAGMYYLGLSIYGEERFFKLIKM